MLRKNRFQSLLLLNICFFKKVVGRTFYFNQILQVARIGQGIQVDDAVVRILRDEATHDMAADETGATGDQKCA